ncbi:hypothetical protein ACTND8_11630 [Atopobiaceae bacterium HCP3S3_F7]|uniref:hypothetical protein n=1 Tax=Bacillati TaxID=1783272 RepID=UPI003F893A05
MTPVAFPPHVRAILYYAMFFVGLTLGAVQIGYGAASVDQPTWLTVALAVFAFVSSGLGLTAASNTTVEPRRAVEEHP